MLTPPRRYDFRAALDRAVRVCVGPWSWPWLVPAALSSALSAYTGGTTIFLVLVAQLALLWHCFSLLGRFAAGEPEIRSERAEETATISAFVSLAGAWLILYLIRLFAESLSPGAGAGAALFVSWVMPAVIILIALEHGAWASLKPERLWLVMSSLRGKYISLWLCMVLYSLLGSSLEAAFSGTAHGFAVVFFAELFILWLLLVGFCLCGWCMHEHRLELGFLNAQERSDQVREAMHSLAAKRPSPSALIEQGRHEEALLELYETARTEPNQIFKQQEYFDALMLYGTPQKQATQAAQLLRAYVRAERAADVAKLMQTWWPALAEDVTHFRFAISLAQLCAKGQQIELARDVLRRFEAANLGLMDLPEVLLAHAQLLASQPGATLQQEARQRAEAIERTYRHHPAAAQARELLASEPGP